MEENKDFLAELNDMDLEDIVGGKIGTAGAVTIATLVSAGVTAALCLGIPAAIKKAKTSKPQKLGQDCAEMYKLEKKAENGTISPKEQKKLDKLSEKVYKQSENLSMVDKVKVFYNAGKSILTSPK